MFILRGLLSTLQTEFKAKSQRGSLFIYTLLSIVLPFTACRASGLLRSVVVLFKVTITQRRFYIFMASPKLPWQALWLALWKLIPAPTTIGLYISFFIFLILEKLPRLRQNHAFFACLSTSLVALVVHHAFCLNAP